MYISMRYVGIIYAVVCSVNLIDRCRVSEILDGVAGSNNDDHSCRIMFVALNWMNGVITAILGVTMIARFHSMYQRSGKVLLFLTVVFLVVNITDGVIAAITTRCISGEMLILPGIYLCYVDVGGGALWSTIWVLVTVWEVLALDIALWIAVKHFRELQRHSAGGIIGDC
ncbi:hypothetical protein BDR05DRAFT_503117 [Suillus weaverae]|nr:hypothetical protein BDR05DRAFT_503117 [Suillus weaverae]